MKKFIFMVMCALCCSFTTMNAQSHEYAQSSNKLLDNTYVSVNAGAITPLDFNSVFPLNVVSGIKVGKDFTPVFGVNVEGTAIFGDNNSTWIRGFINPSKTFVKATNVGVNGTINLTNLFLGYNENKTFRLGFEGGFGWLHMFPDTKVTNRDDLSAKTGLTFDWGVTSDKALHVFAEPVIYWNLTRNGDVQFNKNYAQLGLFVGVTYRFKTSNNTHNFKVYDITDLNTKINSLREENEALKNRKPEVIEKTIIKEVQVSAPVYVFFAKNSDKLTDDAKAILDKVTGDVEVTATASPEGTKTYNQKLSERRANVVSEYLKSKGVNVTSIKGLGVVNATSNRVGTVIVK